MENESVIRKYPVLVIDDQENWRELLCEILDDQFDVTCVKDYRSALAAIQRQEPPYHVVVTDMRLEDGQPGNEDGLRLAEYLNNRCSETKTILVTGYSTVFTARKALAQLGAFDYIEKYPSEGARKFDFQQFRLIVRKAAEAAEQIRSTRQAVKSVTKYVSASIHSDFQESQSLQDSTLLKSGHAYAVRLSLEDSLQNGAEPIVLDMPARHNAEMSLDLFIYGKHLRVVEGTEARWNLLASPGSDADFEFTIIPEFEGNKQIFVELYQNHRLLLRISRTLKVIEGPSK